MTVSDSAIRWPRSASTVSCNSSSWFRTPTSSPTCRCPPCCRVSNRRQVIQQISSRIRAPYILQSALTVERAVAGQQHAGGDLHQLARAAPASARKISTRRCQARTTRAVPNSGQFPLGHPGPVELMESSGVYNQNQVIANVNCEAERGALAIRLLRVQSRAEQYGRNRHLSGESLQLLGRVRSGINRCASSLHRRRLDQFEVGGAHQPVHRRADRRPVRHHRRAATCSAPRGSMDGRHRRPTRTSRA